MRCTPFCRSRSKAEDMPLNFSHIQNFARRHAPQRAQFRTIDASVLRHARPRPGVKNPALASGHQGARFRAHSWKTWPREFPRGARVGLTQPARAGPGSAGNLGLFVSSSACLFVAQLTGQDLARQAALRRTSSAGWESGCRCRCRCVPCALCCAGCRAACCAAGCTVRRAVCRAVCCAMYPACYVLCWVNLPNSNH